MNRAQIDLLVKGYIRFIEHELKITIPGAIIKLFTIFYQKTIPPYKRYPGCIFDEETGIFTSNGLENVKRTYAIFDVPWNKGKHEIVFKCIEDNKFAFGIGILTNLNANTSRWLFDDAEGGITYQIYSCTGDKYKPGIYHFESGEERLFENIDEYITDGMIISVKVDLDEYTLNIYIDGQQKGKTIKVKENEIYYPAITYNCDISRNVHGDYSKYQFISCD